MGRAHGDVPRAFDARLLHEDDAVVRLGEAEQKPRPQWNVPGDDEKVPSSRPPRRILDDSLAATCTALSHAVGEWARIWPLQTLVRPMGAYFIRRDSKDPLYRLVLEWKWKSSRRT